jgi:uncharacterized protein
MWIGGSIIPTKKSWCLGALREMETWTALILGLAGSLHCAGMCGPLALALPAPAGGPVARVANRMLYNLGRVATYGLIGLLFGVFGKALALAGVQRWFSIGMGAVLLLGVIAGRLEGWSRPLAVPVGKLKTALGALLRQRSMWAIFLIGLLNGLLPCGLVYVAAAAAVTTGGILSAIKYMLVFGFGTTPMMLALSLAGGWLPASVRLRFQKIIPACVALVAVLLILRGLGLGIPYRSPICSLHGKACCH